MVDNEDDGGDAQVADNTSLPTVVETTHAVQDTQNKIQKISSNKRRLQITDTGVTASAVVDEATVPTNVGVVATLAEVPAKRGRGRPRKDGQIITPDVAPAVTDTKNKMKRISGNKFKDARNNLPVPIGVKLNTTENGGVSTESSRPSVRVNAASKSWKSEWSGVGDEPIINVGNNKDAANRLYNATGSSNIVDAKFEEVKDDTQVKPKLVSPGHRLPPHISDNKRVVNSSVKSDIGSEEEPPKMWGAVFDTKKDEEIKETVEATPDLNDEQRAQIEGGIRFWSDFKSALQQTLQAKRDGRLSEEDEAKIKEKLDAFKQAKNDFEQKLKNAGKIDNKPVQQLLGKMKEIEDLADREFNTYVSRLPPIIRKPQIDTNQLIDVKDQDIIQLTDEELEDLSKRVKEKEQQIQEGKIVEPVPMATKELRDKIEKEIADREELDKVVREAAKIALQKEKENETPEDKAKREKEEASLTEEEKKQKEKDREDATTDLIKKEVKTKGVISATEDVAKSIEKILGIADKVTEKTKDSKAVKEINDARKKMGYRYDRMGSAELAYMRYRGSAVAGSIKETARQKRGAYGSLVGSSHRDSLYGHYDSKRNIFGNSRGGGINTTHHSFGTGGNSGRTPMVGKTSFGSLTTGHTGAKDAGGSIGGTHIGAKDASGSIGGYHGSKDASGSIGGIAHTRDAGGSIGGTNVQGVNFTRDAGGSVRPHTGKDASGSIGGGSGKDATGSILGNKHKMIAGAQTVHIGDIVGQNEDGSPVYATEQDVQMAMSQRGGMVALQKQGNALGYGTNSKTARPSGMIRGNLKDANGNSIGVGIKTKAGHPSQIMAGYKKTTMITGEKKGTAVTGSPKEGNPVAGVGHTSGIMRGYKNKDGAVTATGKQGNPVAGVGHTSGIMRGYGSKGAAITDSGKEGNPVAGVGHTSGIMRGYSHKNGGVVTGVKGGNPVAGVGHTSGIMRGYEGGTSIPVSDEAGVPISDSRASQMMVNAGRKKGNSVPQSGKGGHPSQIARGFKQSKTGNPVPADNKGGHPSGMMRNAKASKPIFATQVNGFPTVNAQTGETMNVAGQKANVIISAQGRVSSNIARKIQASQANRAQFEVGERTGNPVRVLNEATRIGADGSPSQMMRDKFSAPVAVTATMGNNASFENVAAKSLQLRSIIIPMGNKVPVITPLTTSTPGERFRIPSVNEPYIIPPKTMIAPPVAASSIVSRSAMLDPDSGVIPLSVKDQRIKAGLSFSRTFGRI